MVLEMKKTLYRLIRCTILSMLRPYERLARQFTQIKVAMCYVKGVQTARLAFLGYLGLKALVALNVLGVVLIHVGFFLWLPLSIGNRAIVMLALGFLYLIIGALSIMFLADERLWMDKTGADEFVNQALHNEKKNNQRIERITRQRAKGQQ